MTSYLSQFSFLFAYFAVKSKNFTAFDSGVARNFKRGRGA